MVFRVKPLLPILSESVGRCEYSPMWKTLISRVDCDIDFHPMAFLPMRYNLIALIALRHGHTADGCVASGSAHIKVISQVDRIGDRARYIRK